jgi:hypothetical protein
MLQSGGLRPRLAREEAQKLPQIRKFANRWIGRDARFGSFGDRLVYAADAVGSRGPDCRNTSVYLSSSCFPNDRDPVRIATVKICALT